MIHALEVEMPEEIPEKKKQIKTLHIQADEDHVALQFYRKKGDLQISENGRKSNTVMPKLILLYEDIMEEGKPGSKRYRLTGKHYFGGVYEGAEANEDLWLEVQQYIYDNYDTEYLENIYISQETVHRGSYQAVRFWKKVNLCWINFIFGNTSVQRQVI